MKAASLPKDCQVSPVALVTKRKAYKVPRHKAPMDLMLDGNEGQPPSQALYDALQESGIKAAARYPSAASLESHLAKRWALPRERIIATAGADDAIDRISRVMLAEGKEMIFPTPSFEMMARYGEVAGGTINRVTWTPGTPYPLADVLAKISDNTGIIAVISPNNPTGVTTPIDVVHALADAAPHAVILFDLAYVEFADEDTTLAALEKSNVLVTRTLSKAWGLAGLRIGYALGHPQVIEWMRVAGEPYAVAGPSLVLAEARMTRDQAQVEAFVERVKKERTQLEALLETLGLAVTPSQGNFVFAKGTTPQVAWLQEGLAGLGIAIRTFPGNPALEGCVRITCPGDEDAFARLTHAVTTALSPEAILFDMDGVLVDVSLSYRAAIVETARHFGVEVGFDDIAAIKAAGDANNDWVVTQRLIAQGGKEISLDVVTAEFERRYQGTPEEPGLREKETLLVDRDWLSTWKQRGPLAIVTGRPRQDAMVPLERFGLMDLFDALVCMEDATPKPDPAPVSLAMERLGIKRAWMLGDTPDDIRAARGASVLPIGVVAKTEDATQASDTLLTAGAAQALNQTSDLSQLMPILAQKGERS